MLLEMATPDAIARLPASGLKAEAKVIWNVYFHEQQHSSLAAFVSHMLKSDKAHLKKRRQEGLLVQVSRSIYLNHFGGGGGGGEGRTFDILLDLLFIFFFIKSPNIQVLRH